MFINEAVEQSMKNGTLIYRKKYNDAINTKAYILPSNSYETCMVLVFREGKYERGSRCWNPTADDLMADDWEIFDPKKEGGG